MSDLVKQLREKADCLLLPGSEWISVEDTASALREAADAIERLRGITPEMPPMPPAGEGMPRYGLRWNGPEQPLATPMADGYWTPWHLADKATAEMEAEEKHLYKLVTRQGRLLSGVVNAIRGEPDELTSWSHRDAPELARKVMVVVHAARAVLHEYQETLAPNTNMDRLREVLADMPSPEIVCEACGGAGEAMAMVCYGGPPQVVKQPCEPCGGQGFIRDTRELIDQGAPLPGWESVARKSERGEALNPVEAFIMRLTPGDTERAGDFRRMLRAVLDYTRAQPKVDER